MNSKVIIVPDKSGVVISLSPGHSKMYQVNIQQHKCALTPKGEIKKVIIKSIIMGDYDDLDRLLTEGFELDGTIVVRDSITPYESADKDLRKDEDTEVVLKYNNNPIYRKNFYSTNKHTRDEIIEHNNYSEIQSARFALRSLK